MSLTGATKTAPWRRVANATWTPLGLLGLSLLLIAAPLLQWPVRLVLNLLPFTALFLAVWWALRRVARLRTVNLALGVLCVVCVIPAYAESPEFAAPVRARVDSPVLWSMTLQHPDQAIGRYIRLPDNWPEKGAEYRSARALAGSDTRGRQGCSRRLTGCPSVPCVPQAPMGTPPQHSSLFYPQRGPRAATRDGDHLATGPPGSKSTHCDLPGVGRRDPRRKRILVLRWRDLAPRRCACSVWSHGSRLATHLAGSSVLSI